MREKLGVSQSPIITINGITFTHDRLNPNSLFKKICSMLPKRPEQCREISLINKKDEIIKDFEREWGAENSTLRKNKTVNEMV